MPNLELDFPLPDGRKPLPGFRLRRVEMLNWGTFHGKVAVLAPEGRWTLLVGENGSGKSTAVDALRTLLVPPRLLNYNDASGEQKRKDRTRRSYIRGTWASISQEESASAIPQHLRNAGEFSILLGSFANEHTGEVVVLSQVLWEINDKIDERYAVARADKSIREHLANLGQSRDVMKTLRQRGFEPFDSFSAYSERFRSLLGIPNETALEVFNQAIGVKEVVDINHFIRRHMLEGSDVLDFIHNRLHPHFNELDACWRAIERAEKQILALSPIAECYRRIEEAKTRRAEAEKLHDLAPLFYAAQHLELRTAEAESLNETLQKLNSRKAAINEAKQQDEKEHRAKLQEIAADKTQQSIERLETKIDAEGVRLSSRQTRRNEFTNHLKTLNRARPVESEDDFNRVQGDVEQQRGLVQGNRDDADNKRVKLLVEKQQAETERERLGRELETLRNRRVLIPSDFLVIRDAVCAAANIPVQELPFAGELMEVKNEFRDWTGAIERLLHQFGVSLLVPEKRYIAVAKFINQQHLGIRFTFHRVPVQTPAVRREMIENSERVPGRLNFLENHSLTEWVRAEVTRRFNHFCCRDVQRLNEVDFGITKEGLIRDGPTRHTKDDRRAVNDVTNFVLGWSVEAKIKALKAAFGEAERKAAAAGQKAEDAKKQVNQFDAQLQSIAGVLAIASFSEIDFRSVQIELSRLREEKRQLEESSESLQVLRKQLDAVAKRLEKISAQAEDLAKEIGRVERDVEANETALKRLKEKIAQHDDFAPDTVADAFEQVQEADRVTLGNVREVEEQVCVRLRRQMSHQDGVVTKARDEMLPKMADFLRDYPEHTQTLRAEPEFAADFAALREQIDKDELPQHKQRFEKFLGENLVGDTAMFHSNLLEHEKSIRLRVDSVNAALEKIPFSNTTHVQVIALPTRADDIRQFRAEIRDCLSGGLNPGPDDRLRIFTRIREMMTKFEKDDAWTRRVTDARNWLEFGVREVSNADGREVNFYSASSGKSGGQKAKLAFTILASAITAQYGLIGAETEAETFRVVVIDEAFAKTDEPNSQRALELFKNLGLQLIVVNPFDAKGRIVEDYVDSFHLAVNPEGNNSKLRRASRAEYESALDTAAGVGGAAPKITTSSETDSADAQP